MDSKRGDEIANKKLETTLAELAASLTKQVQEAGYKVTVINALNSSTTQSPHLRIQIAAPLQVPAWKSILKKNGIFFTGRPVKDENNNRYYLIKIIREESIKKLDTLLKRETLKNLMEEHYTSHNLEVESLLTKSEQEVRRRLEESGSNSNASSDTNSDAGSSQSISSTVPSISTGKSSLLGSEQKPDSPLSKEKLIEFIQNNLRSFLIEDCKEGCPEFQDIVLHIQNNSLVIDYTKLSRLSRPFPLETFIKIVTLSRELDALLNKPPITQEEEEACSHRAFELKSIIDQLDPDVPKEDIENIIGLQIIKAEEDKAQKDILCIDINPQKLAAAMEKCENIDALLFALKGTFTHTEPGAGQIIITFNDTTLNRKESEELMSYFRRNFATQKFLFNTDLQKEIEPNPPNSGHGQNDSYTSLPDIQEITGMKPRGTLSTILEAQTPRKETRHFLFSNEEALDILSPDKKELSEDIKNKSSLEYSLKRYIARIENHHQENGTIDFESGFHFFKKEQAASRRANYLTARNLLDKLEKNPDTISKTFSEKEINCIREQQDIKPKPSFWQKHISKNEIRSSELNKIIRAARKIQ